MTESTGFDRTLSDWLDEMGADDAPPHTRTAAIERARGSRRVDPRHRFLTRWLPRTTDFPVARPLPLVGSVSTARLGLALALLVLAVIAAALLAVGVSPAPPTIVHNGLIAFAQDGDIWATDPDDTSRRPITSGPALDSSPIWSDQGDRIAYWSRRTPVGPYILMMSSADGMNQRELRDLGRFDVTDGLPPVWSPDEARIAYSVNDGIAYWIETVDLASGRHIRVADGQAPAWSPDGASFAYQGGPGREGIWVVAADGTSPRRLAAQGTWPAWSGHRIGYVEMRRLDDDVSVINEDGTGALDLTDSAFDDEHMPSWSPDGSRLAFLRALCTDDCGWGVVVASPDGTSQRTLRAPRGHDRVQAVIGDSAPVWSPDGSMIVAPGIDGHSLLVFDTDGDDRDQARTIVLGDIAGWQSWQRSGADLRPLSSVDIVEGPTASPG